MRKEETTLRLSEVSLCSRLDGLNRYDDKKEYSNIKITDDVNVWGSRCV